jgi:hypothetical protein
LAVARPVGAEQAAKAVVRVQRTKSPFLANTLKPGATP